ncbi:MAG: MarR family winged helix-turn-helix transcriptional regulator [Pseudonocardiaceae bacterium]
MSQEDTNPLEQHPGYAVKRLQLAVRIAVDAAVASTTLSMAQFAVLRNLADSGPMPAAELARRCFTTRQSMQDVLKYLRTRKLVESVLSTSSGRTQKLALTAQGKKLLDEATIKVRAVDDRMLYGLTPSQRSQFVSWLNLCANNLKQPDVGGA